MSKLKKLKKVYDKLGNDTLRSTVLTLAEQLGVRKDVIRMDTNNYCNISCIMCNRTNTCLKKQYMSLENFKSIIDIFAPATKILYLSCACEPLATPHFTEYIKYAKNQKIPFISLCTNALSMNHETIACLVDERIDEVIISFNGFKGEDYNRIMQGSDYDRVCANLKELTAYKRSHHSLKPHIRLNTILLKTNLKNNQELINFVLENDIDTVQFRELMLFENQNDPEEVKKELISNLSDEEYEEISLKIKKIANQLQLLGKEVILPLIVKREHPREETAISPPKNSIQKNGNDRKHSCSIPCFSYWIDWEGNVRVCGYDDNGIIGNVLSEHRKQLHKQRRNFQKLALSGECSSELCTMNIDTSTLK